jgi:hypothetical protein
MVSKIRAFKIPPELEIFSDLEAQQILGIGKSKLGQLVRATKLKRFNVAGKWKISGVRNYLAECQASTEPPERSKSLTRTLHSGAL